MIGCSFFLLLLLQVSEVVKKSFERNTMKKEGSNGREQRKRGRRGGYIRNINPLEEFTVLHDIWETCKLHFHEIDKHAQLWVQKLYSLSKHRGKRGETGGDMIELSAIPLQVRSLRQFMSFDSFEFHS